jgi:hypothetical protein
MKTNNKVKPEGGGNDHVHDQQNGCLDIFARFRKPPKELQEINGDEDFEKHLEEHNIFIVMVDLFVAGQCNKLEQDFEREMRESQNDDIKFAKLSFELPENKDLIHKIGLRDAKKKSKKVYDKAFCIHH